MTTIQVTEEQAKEMYNSGIDSLKSIAESNFPELFHKEKKWLDIGYLHGFYIKNDCTIQECEKGFSLEEGKNMFPTKREAESALALSQLLQWRDKANGEKLHEWADFTCSIIVKHQIECMENNLEKKSFNFTFNSLSFKTPKIRDQFIKDHETLLKTYFMID